MISVSDQSGTRTYSHGGIPPWSVTLERDLSETASAHGIRARWPTCLGYFDKGEFEQAAECFSQVLLADPDNPAALKNLGVVFLSLERFQQAKDTFARLVQVLEGTPTRVLDLAVSHQGVGAALLSLWGRAGTDDARSALISEAEREFSRAIELQPNYFPGWVGLGCAFHAMDRLDDAEQAFRSALEIDPAKPLVIDRLRAVLEDKLEKRLFDLGYLSRLNKPIWDFTPYENRQPIEPAGKPLSETIIEERH
jgi:tetratricopeptide (TPR) repeat protein